MNNFLAHLNKPAPLAQERGWTIILMVSAIVFFVLGFIQPFGISEIVVKRSKLFLLLGYTLVTAICTALVVYILPLLFKTYYTKNWTIGKYMFNQTVSVLIIIIGNTLFSYFILPWFGIITGISLWKALLFNASVTLPVACLPLIILGLYFHNMALKKNLQEAQEINRNLKLQTISVKEEYLSPLISLYGSTKESVELHPEQILFLEASGNYVKVSYTDKGESKQKMLRTTIKQIEEAFIPYGYIIRCHRAFIVNTNRIISVEGNSQGYHLMLESTQEEIPVSRAYTKLLRDIIEK